MVAIDEFGEQEDQAGAEPKAHKVHWFQPDRPVDGVTTYRLPVAPGRGEPEEGASR